MACYVHATYAQAGILYNPPAGGASPPHVVYQAGSICSECDNVLRYDPVARRSHFSPSISDDGRYEAYLRNVNVVSHTRLVNKGLIQGILGFSHKWHQRPRTCASSKPILGGCCSQISSTRSHSDVRTVCCTHQMKRDVSNAQGSVGPGHFVAGRQNSQSLFMKRVDISGSMTITEDNYSVA